MYYSVLDEYLQFNDVRRFSNYHGDAAFGCTTTHLIDKPGSEKNLQANCNFGMQSLTLSLSHSVPQVTFETHNHLQFAIHKFFYKNACESLEIPDIEPFSSRKRALVR